MRRERRRHQREHDQEQERAYTIKDYVEIGKVMLPYALLCANHVLNEFYNALWRDRRELHGSVPGTATRTPRTRRVRALSQATPPRYLVEPLVKQVVQQQGEVLRKLVQEHASIFSEKSFTTFMDEISFHNRVVFQGIRTAVFLGTPIGLITWIILAYYSSLFFESSEQEAQSRKRKTRGERRAQAVSRKQCKSLLLAALVYSNLGNSKRNGGCIEEALKSINAQRLQGIETLAEEIRSSAAASSQRETGLTQAFQDTSATVQQQQSQAQEALTAAHTNAATTFEEIGACLEKAVKERKPGEVELHKLTKAPECIQSRNTGKKRRVAGQSFR